MPIPALLLTPLARKVYLYGGIALAVLIGLRVWGNAQWSKGVEVGRKDGIASMEKTYKDSWKAALTRLDEQQKKSDEERKAVALGLATAINRTNTVLAQITKLQSVTLSIQEMEQNHAAANAVPASAIDDTLRAISRQLDELSKQSTHP